MITFIFVPQFSFWAKITCRWRYYIREFFFFFLIPEFVCSVAEHSISAKTPDLLSSFLDLENSLLLNHHGLLEEIQTSHGNISSSNLSLNLWIYIFLFNVVILFVYIMFCNLFLFFLTLCHRYLSLSVFVELAHSYLPL